jgi:hypothetical protein
LKLTVTLLGHAILPAKPTGQCDLPKKGLCAIIQHKLNNTAKEKKMQPVTLNTNGQGLWSRVAKAVRVVDMRMSYISEEKDYGELRVYFDTRTWNVDTDGLIYSDRQFLQELNACLLQRGLAEASYSEQGLQGQDYVSLDVEQDFLQAWENI